MSVPNYSTTRDILRFEGTDRTAYWKRFAMLLGLSVVIATMGLVRNSGAVVIAAMLIAPLMSPILGIAASMVLGRSKRVLGLLGAVVLATLMSIGLAWMIVYIADVPKGMLFPDQITARTDPGTEDLIVALAAGVAAAYVQINRNEVSLLPGAAIGVSLVPPLSAAGVLLYFRNFADAYEAVLLFVTNFAAIVLSACAVYIISGARSSLFKKSKRRFNFTVSMVATLAILGVVILQLMKSTYNRYTETRSETRIANVINEWAGDVSVEIIRVDVNSTRKRADIWVIVDLPFDVQNKIGSISDLLPERLKEGGLTGRLHDVLGDDYAVAFRYQTRLAGLVFLKSEFIIDAPSTEETTDN